MSDNKPLLLNLNNPQALDGIAKNISQKLLGLGFRGIVIGDKIPGPVVTGYPLSIPPAIPAQKILNKHEDIALSCGVESVDIRRVGKEIIIYIPNEKRETVDFKDALMWYLKDETAKTQTLPILLGTDTTGNKITIDLASQPHILIAGSTGSGKSILESNIIASLAMMKSLSELKFRLVDTKNLDLHLFRDLPHVVSVAETVEDWYDTINDLRATVRHRNKKLAEKRARNIEEYNRQVEESEKLPYIILIIDEFADLIEKDLAHKAELGERDKRSYSEPLVSTAIQQLIQICRASGIHVILCTQRTSTDVVSGTIKANFTTRISLKLPSAIDSRTILDSSGAENLLGKGDMLVRTNDSDTLKRYHSPFVRIEDINAILSQRDMILESLGL